MDRDSAFADRVLDGQLRRTALSGPDRGLCTELVYGTLRRLRYLDFLLSTQVDRPLAKTPPEVLTALRLGTYQLVEMGLPPHSAVSQSVALVVGRFGRMRGFVNAVLRALARKLEAGELPAPRQVLRDPMEALATEGAVQTWIARAVAEQLGEQEAEQWLAAMATTPAVSLRVNRTRASAAAVCQALLQQGLEAEPLGAVPHMLTLRGAGEVGRLDAFTQGLVTVQDGAAALVGLLANPQPGQVVLDVCAAPGGKATHLAELMGDRGTVVAVDRHPARTRLVAEAASRLGLRSVHADAVDATDTAALKEALRRHSGAHQADVVVVDAPCSGLGTLRRNPELRGLEPSKVGELAALQQKILDAAAACVKPGGTLVYAVCTITPAEGAEQVERLLSRYPRLALAAPTDGALAPFLTPGDDATTRRLGGPVLRTWTHRHPELDSFFAAHLRSA